MEVEVDHLLQAPGEAVGEADQPSRRAPRRARNPPSATGNTDTAVASAWKNSSVAGEGKSRKNGASTRDGDLEVIAEQVESRRRARRRPGRAAGTAA